MKDNMRIPSEGFNARPIPGKKKVRLIGFKKFSLEGLCSISLILIMIGWVLWTVWYMFKGGDTWFWIGRSAMCLILLIVMTLFTLVFRKLKI